MPNKLLETVEQIIPQVAPEFAAFLSIRLALAEAALGEPIRAIERLQAMPREVSVPSVHRKRNTRDCMEEVILGTSPQLAFALIERVDAPLRTRYLVRAAHARHAAGDLSGAEWLLRRAEARWGGPGSLLRSYAKDHGQPSDTADSIGSSEVVQIAEIHLAGTLDDPHLIDAALGQVITDEDPFREDQGWWRTMSEDVSPPEVWHDALDALIRLRLRTGDLAGIKPLLIKSWLRDGQLLWTILRHSGGASSLRDPRVGGGKLHVSLIADVIDSLLEDKDMEGAHAVYDLIEAEHHLDLRPSTRTSLARAVAHMGDFEGAAALAEGSTFRSLKVEVLLKGFRDTGDPRFIAMAQQAAGRGNLSEHYFQLTEVMIDLRKIEEATLAADQMKAGGYRLSALKAIARAHLERGDAESAAMVLHRAPGLDEEWYRVAIRSALAELQIERGELEAAVETTLSIAELPIDGANEYNSRIDRYDKQIDLLRTITREMTCVPGEDVPPWVSALRDPVLRAVCMIEIACPC